MRHPFLRTLAGAGQVTDPNFENVTLLLHGDGTNGGQNNTFVDGSTNNFTITRNGNTTQGTFSPYGDNWSNYFNTSNTSLVATGTQSTGNFPTGTDFTIEFWWCSKEVNSGGGAIVSKTQYQSNNNDSWWVSADGNNKLAFTGHSGFPIFTPVTSTTLIMDCKWHHCAISRTGTTYRAFVDGVLEQTASNSSVMNQGTRNITFAGITTVNGQDYGASGYISNLRIVKGTCLYTSSFTPSTAPLTAVANTILLTCQSNRFKDNGPNAYTISTQQGTPSVQRFSPFSPSAAYAAGTIGGSGYFDGSGDFLSYGTGNVLLGSSNFTAEAFVYLTATNGANPSAVFYGQGDGSSAAGSSYAFFLRSATNSDLYIGSSAYGIASPVTSIGQWQHVAWVRSGGTYSVFTNGTRTATRADLGTLAVNTGSTSRNPNIGCTDSNGNFPFAGYISNARIIVGSGGYDATQTSITVPTAPLTAITNTSLLLNFQNAAIRDNAMMAVPETVGNAQIDTTTKKFGTGSIKFDGTGDNLLFTSTPNIEFGSGDFTMEFWVNFTSAPSSAIVYDMWNPTNGIVGVRRFAAYFYANELQIGYAGTIIATTGSITWTTGQWYHIAIVRNGSSWKVYRDGTSAATGTNSNSLEVAAGYKLGTNINGYIDDLRITKGVARYTANFTPPTAAFPDL